MILLRRKEGEILSFPVTLRALESKRLPIAYTMTASKGQQERYRARLQLDVRMGFFNHKSM